jgi:hypothetical protein
MASDTRGEVSVTPFMGRDYLVIYTKKGYMRGGEIHAGRQYNVLVEGTVRWVTLRKKDATYAAPALFVTEAEMPHMMESLTDSVMIEWREKPLENPVNYYKPYRMMVEERMRQRA